MECQRDFGTFEKGVRRKIMRWYRGCSATVKGMSGSFLLARPKPSAGADSQTGSCVEAVHGFGSVTRDVAVEQRLAERAIPPPSEPGPWGMTSRQRLFRLHVVYVHGAATAPPHQPPTETAPRSLPRRLSTRIGRRRLRRVWRARARLRSSSVRPSARRRWCGSTRRAPRGSSR